MKILLTGYKGFIGRHMLQALSGHDVRTFDWGENQDLLATNDRDICIHIGGISSTTERNVDKVMRQNYDFSCQLLDQCISTGTIFQYSSSASVYGLGTEFKEHSPVDPRTPYAWSKYMFERYAAKCQKYADCNQSFSTHIQGFRYFNVYGPEGEEHKGNQASPFAQFKKQANETKTIKVFKNSSEYKRDFIHVSEIVNTHLKFFNVEESGIWNLGTGETMSFLDVAKTFDANIVEIPMPEELRLSYQKYTCADLTKLKNTLTTTI